jgi:hypothetical protein
MFDRGLQSDRGYREQMSLGNSRSTITRLYGRHGNLQSAALPRFVWAPDHWIRLGEIGESVLAVQTIFVISHLETQAISRRVTKSAPFITKAGRR